MSLQTPPRGRRDEEESLGGTEQAASGGSPTEAAAGVDPELSESEIFDILRNSRRRRVLTYLREHDGEASLNELTEHVATQEYDIDSSEVSSDQRKCVYTGLYQCHLPRLDDFGVVEFDRDETTVALRDAASQVETYLYRSDAPDAARFELAGATAVASFITVGVLGVGPLGSVPVIGWSFLTALVLLGFAAFHLYR